MPHDDSDSTGRTTATLVDPATMLAVWTSDAGEGPAGLVDAVPMADALGLSEALAQVASTGVARHLRADVITTNKGSMGIVASVHRLPDGMLLVITEHAWQPAKTRSVTGAPGRPGRHSR